MFEYLKPYLDLPQEKTYGSSNSFYSLKKNEVLDCEKYLGYTLPPQLKQFYQEIGYGFLTSPHECREGYQFYNTNRINPPDLMVEMLEHGQESGLISEGAFELLQPGDIPFFEIGDSSSFLKMKALSDNPNAVWDVDDYDPIKIADSLEEFIYKLYYEDPGYYGNIYSAHLDRKKH